MNDFFAKLAQRALNLAPLVRPVLPPMFAWESDYIVSEEHVKTFKNNTLSEPRLQSSRNVDPTTGPNYEVNLSQQIKVGASQSTNDPENKNAAAAEPDSASRNDQNYRKDGNFKNGKSLITDRNSEKYQTVLNTDSILVQSYSFKQGKPVALEHSEPLDMINSSKDTTVIPGYSLRNEALQPNTKIQPIVTKRQSRSLNIEQRLQNNVPNEPAELERRAVTLEYNTEIPTIRVNVGRIEVRAIVPPASPQSNNKVERQNPALTLNDYLKQRDGGKR